MRLMSKLELDLLMDGEAGDNHGDGGGGSGGNESAVDSASALSVLPSDSPVSAVAPAHAKLLSDWFLIRKLIPLEEQQRYGESFWISQIWSSSLIAERRTNRTLITSSGKTYVLVGNMNVPEMHSQGFDEIFCQEFADGFPVNWKACVSAVLDRIAKRTRAARKRSAQAAAAASAASAADPAAAQAASAVSVAAATIAAIAAPTEAASLTAAQTAETADAAEASAAAHELYNEPIPTQPPVSQMQESAAPAVDKHDHQGVEAPDPPPPAPAAISIVQASASNATADGNPEPTTDKEGSQAAATASQTAPNPDSDPSEAAPAPMRERLGTTRRTPRSAVQEEEAAIAFPTLTYRSGSDSAFGHAGASAGAGAGSAAMSVQQLLRVSPEASGSDSKVVAAGERQDGSRRVDDDGDSGINKDGDGDDDADLYWRNERKFVVPIKDAQGRVRAFEPVIVVGSESAMTKIAMRSDGGAPALSASSSSSPSRSANASSAVSRKRARVGGADGGAADAERESKAARRRPDYTDTDSDADAAARGLRSAERRKEQVRVLHTPRRIAVNSGSEGDGGVASDGGGRPRRAVKARK
nr:hypothetical protein HK105_008129 [Polyrhizophydium stewartii]